MKTRKKNVWILMCALVVLGCEKENQQMIDNVSQESNEKKYVVNCTPNQSITGIWAALNTIEALSNCMMMDCTGESVLTSIANHYLLADMNTNSTFIIYNNIPVTPAEQSNIIASAKNWATNNAPAGYFVYYIDYIPNIIVGPGPAAVIDIKVTYHKCVGIVPPPAG